MPEELSDELKADAAGFIDALPASVVMPAGAGKTHLLAAVAKHVVDGGGKVLVITHTNAGVHAVAARMKRFGVTIGVHVTTITSFAVRLARAYPVLGECIVPRVMVPDDSQAYVQAATRALAGAHIQAVLRASYTHVLVDEYQDCNTEHHAMVLKIKDAVGSVGVVGDPLQAIFGFADDLPDWDEVLREFPELPDIKPEPRRWAGHNEDLGAWLFKVRSHLTDGRVLRLDNPNYPPGVRFTDISGSYQGVANAALSALSLPADETVLVISARHAASGRTIAGQLDGLYTVMEEVAGSFIGRWLTRLRDVDPDGYASWLFDFTKKCHAKYGILDPNGAVRSVPGVPYPEFGVSIELGRLAGRALVDPDAPAVRQAPYVWSNQLGTKFECYGFAALADRATVVDEEGDGLVVRYLRDDRVVAVAGLSLGRSRVLPHKADLLTTPGISAR